MYTSEVETPEAAEAPGLKEVAVSKLDVAFSATFSLNLKPPAFIKPSTIIASNRATFIAAKTLLKMMATRLESILSKAVAVKAAMAMPITSPLSGLCSAALVTYMPNAMAFPDKLPRMINAIPYMHLTSSLGRSLVSLRYMNSS